MPTVPYKGYFDVTPSVNPAPRIGVNVPGEAFGTGIGRAIEGAGRDISGVGNEMAQQALTIQGYQNDTWLAQAVAKHMENQGKINEDYYEKEGQDAVDARPKFQADTIKNQEDTLAGAPNQAVRRKALQEIYRRTSYELTNAGRHAAQQARVAQKTAVNAKVQAAVDNPDYSTPEAADATEDSIDRATREQAKVHGIYDETAIKDMKDKNSAKAQTGYFAKRFSIDPDGAIEQWDYAQKNHPINSTASANIQAHGNHQEVMVGTRRWADKIVSGAYKVDGGYDPNKPDGGLDAMLKQGEEVTEKYGKNNPEFPYEMQNAIRHAFGVAEAARRDTQRRAINTLDGYISGQRANDPVVDRSGLEGKGAPDDVRRAWGAIDEKTKMAFDRQIESNLKHVVNTPEGDRNFDRLMGMSRRPDHSEFLDTPIAGQPGLTWAQRKTLERRKQQLINRDMPDSDINKYMGNVRVKAAFEASLVGLTAEEKQAHRDTFAGALEREVNIHKQEHKTVDDKWLHETGQRLMQEIVTNPGWITDTKQRQYEVEMTDKVMTDRIIRGYAAKYGEYPDIYEVRARYIIEKRREALEKDKTSREFEVAH